MFILNPKMVGNRVSLQLKRIVEVTMPTEITIHQVKERYPNLGETGVKLTHDYINLRAKALELKLIDKKELQEIESRYEGVEITIVKLQYLSADILTGLKNLVNEINVPKDSIEFEEWERSSEDYPKVACHDQFVDLFISSNEAASKGWE